MASTRRDMIAGEIQKVLSGIIRTEVKNPHVPPITSVIGVEVAPDLDVAKVRISVMGDQSNLAEAVKALNDASGFIRHQLGSSMRLRRVPRLVFVEDASIQHSIEVQKILDNIHKEEEKGKN